VRAGARAGAAAATIGTVLKEVGTQYRRSWKNGTAPQCDGMIRGLWCTFKFSSDSEKHEGPRPEIAELVPPSPICL
jgi:hypothetical protein